MDTTVVDTLTRVAEAASSGLGWAEISALVLAVLGLIQVIVRITPTKKDDQILNPIIRILTQIFTKTNTKDELKDNAKTVIVNEAIARIAEKHPDAADIVEEVASKVMGEAEREGEEKGAGVLDSITPKTELGKKIFAKLDERLDAATPKTKAGKGLKRLLKRIR